MLISGFRKKAHNFYTEVFASVNLVLSRYVFSSAGSKALFVVLFLFTINSNAAQAASSVNFLVDPSYDANGRTNIGATVRATGVYVYFYVENDYWNLLSSSEKESALKNINALVNEFDYTIYPKMKSAYGDEWNPGIDGDPRIYILLTDIVKDAGGYFNKSNEYSKNILDQYKINQLAILNQEKKADIAAGRSIDSYAQRENEIVSIYTNEKELLYLNANFLDRSSMRSYIAHEFQHMINWSQKKKISDIDEEIWLNEGLSEYSSTLLGYDNPYPESVIELRINTFFQYTPDSLTEWQNVTQDYASVNLFMQYLVDHYGVSILKGIVSSQKSGIGAINESLRNQGYNTSFSEVFSDWQIANYLNDKSIFNGKYSYSSPILSNYIFRVKPTETLVVKNNTPINNVEYTKDWSGKWFEFTTPLAGDLQSRALKFIFSVNDAEANFKIPYIIKNIDGSVRVGEMNLNSLQNGTVLFDNFNTKIASVIILPISEKKTSGFSESEPLVKFTYSVSLSEMNIPRINNISPNISSLAGGTRATIIGENFNINSIVKFGGIAAEIQIPDSKTIIAIIPPSSKSGNVNVEVINSLSPEESAAENFTYLSLPENGSLIRAEGDYKVYVINGKYKRWIQSAEIFKYYPHFGWKNVAIVSPQIRDYYLNSYLIRADGDYKVYEINTDNSKHHLAISASQFAASGRSWDMVFIINKMERNFYRTGSTITK